MTASVPADGVTISRVFYEILQLARFLGQITPHPAAWHCPAPGRQACAMSHWLSRQPRFNAHTAQGCCRASRRLLHCCHNSLDRPIRTTITARLSALFGDQVLLEQRFTHSVGIGALRRTTGSVLARPLL